ncbi:hypothetical protein HY78_08515 [Rhizorhabdus wittichii DC-6]|nr:hypothetical protein HY78_08515 [Rhizorhabdus wittichii DC-6]
MATCVPGEPLQLVLEPDNPADPNAIMIVTQRGIQIGYVAAERAPFIGKHMREGAAVLAVFQEATQRGAIIRVSLDGSVPELPERRESLNPQPTDYDHYFSDPIWPDD